MTRNKKIALWVIAALQFNATLFFVIGVAMDMFDLEYGIFNTDRFEAQFLVQAAGLVLGVVLGWVALRMSLQRAYRAEEKLRHLSVDFSALMDEYFANWHLTTAEKDVAVFLIKGLSTKDIAQLRGTSDGTIKAQTNAIYRKAGVTGRPQLLSLFIEDLMEDSLGSNLQAAA